MSKRHPLARYTLPTVVNPATHRCFTVNVPNDIYHVAAFKGQMEALAHAYVWHNDEAHTAKDVAAVWRGVVDGIDSCMPQVQFRQLSDCVLEASFDGGLSWATIYSGYACASGAITDALNSGTIPNPVQPQAGGVIEPDVCKTYHVVLFGNSRWHSPIPITTGYEIRVTNAKGGWWDGNVIRFWECPDGNDYVFGECGGGTPTYESTDPLPSVYHGRLIGNYGTAFFDAYDTLTTIPSGYGNTDLYFQMNDSVLADNQGSIEFDVEICNHSSWCHHFDFTSGLHGWTLPIGTQDSSGIHTAIYSHYTLFSAHYVLPFTSHFRSYRFKGTWQTGNYTGDDAFRLLCTNGTEYLYQKSNSQMPNGAYDLTQSVNTTAQTNLYLEAVPDWATPLVDNATITDLWITGEGDNPFGSSNC